MDALQVIAGGLTLGATLGGTLAGFFAIRQKTLIAVLREGNEDYKKRVDQLEEEAERKDAQIKKLTLDVKQLQTEKQLPLDQLAKTMRDLHAYQMDSIDKLVIMVHDLVQVQHETNQKKVV